MMHYAGVMTEESLPEATSFIQFPKGEYIVVKGEANSDEELANILTGVAFGEVLGQVTEVSYVGAKCSSDHGSNRRERIWRNVDSCCSKLKKG